MAAPSITSIMEAHFRYEVNSGSSSVPCLNVMHFAFDQTSVNPAPDMGALCAAIDALWAAQVLPLQSNQVVYDKTELLEITGKLPNVGSTYELTYGLTAETYVHTDTDGGTVSESLPAFASASVQKRTGRFGRHWHGRLALAGIPENSQDAGLLGAGWKASVDAAFGQFVGPFVPIIGFCPVYGSLFQRTLYGQLAPLANANPSPFNAFVTSYVTHDREGTQRTRRFKDLR